MYNPFVKLGELEKRIGAELLKGPKTAEELSKILGVDIKDVMVALKNLLVYRLITKEGNPPRYSLAPHVVEALKNDEDAEGLLVHAIVEVQGVEERAVKESLKKIIEKLESEKGFIVKSASISDVERDEESNAYYGHIDATIIFPALEPLFYFVFFYGPTVVELLTAKKIEVDPGDLQRALLLSASMVHSYVTYISQLMTREEIEEFNRKILKELGG